MPKSYITGYTCAACGTKLVENWDKDYLRVQCPNAACNWHDTVMRPQEVHLEVDGEEQDDATG